MRVTRAGVCVCTRARALKHVDGCVLACLNTVF